MSYGIQRVDHIVTNVPNMIEAITYVSNFTGFHQFAEFTAEDVGTVDSGLNSMVLGNNNEMVLLPFNEPTYGTKRKSQIQTYLEQNEGAGVQHIAVKTNDIFVTLREMRQRRFLGGFEFMPRPSDKYETGVSVSLCDVAFFPASNASPECLVYIDVSYFVLLYWTSFVLSDIIAICRQKSAIF
jgi:4-hydroxyphenylpyruvate dioxygenase